MKRYCVATDSLFNLSGPGKPLKAEPPDTAETAGLLRTGRARLMDAGNAAHALCLAALRRQGYRPSQRYIVFQVLPHTLGLGPEVWRVLDKCHNTRNLGEYEGLLGHRRAPGQRPDRGGPARGRGFARSGCVNL